MFNKLMSFFSTKKEIFPDVPIEDNDFSRNLPPNVYLYLRDRGLLDGQEHVFSKDNKKRQVKIEYLPPNESPFPPVVKPFPGGVSTTIQLTDSTMVIEVYSKQVWHMTTILKDGCDYVNGNKDRCPLDGLTNAECIKKTPEKAKNLIAALEKVIPGNISSITNEKRSSMSFS